MGLKILFTEDTAQNIMEKDAKLLEELKVSSDPILHLYRWKNPSITYGHFIKIEKMLNLEEVEKLGIDLAKRPTGGGVIFHLYDYAFSFLLPSSSQFFSINPLDNYHFVHQIILSAIHPILQNEALQFLPQNPKDDSMASHFCMAKPTIFDLMIEDRKIVGAAQRKKSQGYLHQGSIALKKPDRKILEKVLVDSHNVSEKMVNYSFYFLDHQADSIRTLEFQEMIKKLLIDSFTSTFCGD